MPLVLWPLLGCTPPGEADTPANRDSDWQHRPARRVVQRWYIVTKGDTPPSCHERLAASDTPLREDLGGVTLEIIHLEDMAQARLRQLSYTIDGHCAFSWRYDSMDDSPPDQLNVALVDLPPGAHRVELVAIYGPRLQSVSHEYVVQVRGSYDVDVDSSTRLFVTSEERGSPLTPLERRHVLSFETAPLLPAP